MNELGLKDNGHVLSLRLKNVRDFQENPKRKSKSWSEAMGFLEVH